MFNCMYNSQSGDPVWEKGKLSQHHPSVVTEISSVAEGFRVGGRTDCAWAITLDN
jgi:hypothetical protein